MTQAESPRTNDSITDQELRVAIAAAHPFTYLDDLKKSVATYFGNPTLFGDRAFGYRVYCLNRQVREETTAKRVASMGFVEPTLEVLARLCGRPVEMLAGVGGLMGEEVLQGRIKSNGAGGFLFIPKGNRTRGYSPRFIRWREPGSSHGQRLATSGVISIG